VTDAEIERIVQEVIRRLMSLGVRVGSSPMSALTIEDRVITLSTIEGQLEGIQQVIVQPKAVVTPSVRDELRQKKIELLRQ